MKTSILVSAMSFLLITSAFSQGSSIEISFTAIENEAYVQLEAIKVINRTQYDTTTLFWPDTSLVLNYGVGTPEISSGENQFQIFQNYPNPVADQTTISLFVPEKDLVNITITDMMGRVILHTDNTLDKGIHTFRFTPGDGDLFFFTAKWRKKASSIKILLSGSKSYGDNLLEYVGSEGLSAKFKAGKDIQDLVFSIGDTLLFIGYFNGLQSGIVNAPEENKTYNFQFATNIPCPGAPTVDYEGQVYNTIQIYSLCWLKENLNIGTKVSPVTEMSDDGEIEKYCVLFNEDSCSKYGGLYQWDEMMQYSTQQGAQGICPPDWHIPSDEELKVLVGSVDTQYAMGDEMWDSEGWLGSDASFQLKSTSGWYGSWNGSDMFGFSGLPGGLRSSWGNGSVIDVGTNGSWFTSSEVNPDQVWGFHFHGNELSWFKYYKTQGFSVRCVKDY